MLGEKNHYYLEINNHAIKLWAALLLFAVAAAAAAAAASASASVALNNPPDAINDGRRRQRQHQQLLGGRVVVNNHKIVIGDIHDDGQGDGGDDRLHAYLQPVGGRTNEYRMAVNMADGRGRSGSRMLGPFQVCLQCKCCAGGSSSDPTTCATMPCCFGIDCQLPNKPFGVCAFVPKTCDCTDCAV